MPTSVPLPHQSAREQFSSLLQETLRGLGRPTLINIVQASRVRGTPHLNKSSVSEWRRGKSLPETRDLLESLLRALDHIAGTRGLMDREQWQRIHAAALKESRNCPSEPASVRDWTAMELGVHKAQLLPNGPALTPYVRRDVDATVELSLRRLLGEGGMVLLTGDSAAGKTRTAYRAMKTVAPDSMLLAPQRSGDLADAVDSAVSMAQRGMSCILWLNDAERFLGTHGLTMQQFRRLRSARAVVVATLRDVFQQQLLTDSVAADILNLADEIHVERLWSPAEILRAAEVAESARDSRLTEAFQASNEHGIAEYLAAGPQLWRELQQASRVEGNPRGAALVHAAIDLARAGISGAIAREALVDLHERLLPGSNAALLTPESLDRAWSWVTEARYGTTRHLIPAGDGWQAFDYLVDAVMREKAPAPLTEEVWDTALALAVQSHQRHDVALAAFANDRSDVGERSLGPLAEAGDVDAMRSLGVLHRRRDPKRAKSWLKRAIAAGDTDSMRLLGNQYIFQNQRGRAEKWYRKAAKAGDPESEAYFNEPGIYPQPRKELPEKGTSHHREESPDEEDDDNPWQPSARTLKVLEAALDIACDITYDAIEEIGGKAIKPKKPRPFMLGDLPSQTWRQSRRWRRKFARCYDDLAQDIRAGRLPTPTCTGEEMALHMALQSASAMTLDERDFVDELTLGLPESPDDFDWDDCKDLLFQDHDVLWLYWPWMSGIEDPTDAVNRFARVAYLRPEEWFEPFRKDNARTPDRGHRR
ncbi:tetratricopeptide repeat protein [Streptomyces sp. NPDC057694]|uniref:tetratricopeptide repeat protein n=1 Tax=Streptomyces sp. NPDC057694 TaxID=3346216 RepID=UPI0036738841